MLLRVLDLDLVVADTVSNRHGEVGKGGKGGDESSQDMEHAFLLATMVSFVAPMRQHRQSYSGCSSLTTGTRKAMA